MEAEMLIQGRNRAFEVLVVLASMAAMFGSPAVSLAQPFHAPDAMLADAELNDVFFLDPDRGWVVGDRGVIWVTDDGGRHWRLQGSPVPCRLESVWFVDDRRGWIVGGWTHPYTHRTTGVVLRTSDGGQRWEALPRLSLPALKGVKFFDLRNGWALGNASALYPAGVFRTEDGGLSWSSVAAAGNAGWLSGDFPDAQGGVVAGRQPTAAQVRQRGAVIADSPPPGLRAARCVRLGTPSAGPPASPVAAGAASGWLVGDGGLVLRTGDGGRSWAPPAARLPGGMAEYFDFHSVAVSGERCWIAGTPGTRVLHSADGGRNWQVFDTGQPLPLRALTFLDEHRGWAVGAMGTILATRDGGRTWQTQRRGGERAAWLCLASQADSVPLELVVSLSGNEGFLGAVEVLNSTPGAGDGSQAAHAEDRLREAVSILGGSQANLAWGFPLPLAGRNTPLAEIGAGWDRLHGSPAHAKFHEYLVRKIRQWRPEVIVTEPISPRGENELAQLINQTVLAAVEAAADPLAEPDQSLVTGLKPWPVKKVFSFEGPEQPGTQNLTTAQLAPRMGQSLADQATLGRQLLDVHHQWPARTLGFRLLQSRLPAELSRQDFFSGIPMQPGSPARRQLHAPPPKDMRTISRLIQQRRNIEQLLRYTSTSSQREATWLGQVEDLIRDLDAQSGAQVLFELAQSLQRSGQLNLAADVYDFLLRRFPADPLCEAAAIWLVQFSASSEARWAFERPGMVASAAVPPAAGPAVALPSGVVPAGYPAENPTAPPAGLPEGAELALSVVESGARDRTRQSVAYAQWIRDRFPPLFVDPAVRFPLLAAQRTTRAAGESDGYLNSLVASRAPDAWWACAKSELWFESPTRVAPKPVAICARTSQPPRLDGRLDDPAWAAGIPLSLVSDQGDDARWPAAVLLACDDEFLYVAASCRKVPSAAYPASSGPRPRDPDLSQRDRIEVLIDVDRDYATYYRLVIDHRGWVRDECLGSDAWNPQWYVAAAEDDGSWTVECAIAWRELVETPPDRQQYWAIGLQRIAPGGGFQSWNQPATPTVRPEGFGLLKFQ
jgi:photosystem II stability/assembly factor-like uncharacterized protein